MLLTIRISSEEWAVALRVCTPRQLQVLDLWRRGFGWKRIAGVLGLDTSTVRAHALAGRRRVVEELEREAAA